MKLDTPVTIVSSTSANASSAEEENGITVIYYFKSLWLHVLQILGDSSSTRSRSRLQCHPVCPETAALIVLCIIFILALILPPVVCARLTRRWRMVAKSPDLPLLTQRLEALSQQHLQLPCRERNDPIW